MNLSVKSIPLILALLSLWQSPNGTPTRTPTTHESPLGFARLLPTSFLPTSFTIGQQLCRDLYPPPGDRGEYTGCSIIGRSACGGPDQCACASTERLVSVKCDQGTYNECEAEPGNGCQ
jgi:hypothetical protein